MLPFGIRRLMPLPTSQDGRSARRSLRRWLQFRFRAGERNVTLAVIAIGVSLFGVVRFYVTPERLRASRDIERISAGLKETFAAESVARGRTGDFADPGPLFRRRANGLGIGYVTVQASVGDQNHWYVKLRDDSAATVCTHLVTFLDERDVVRPRCRVAELSDR